MTNKRPLIYLAAAIAVAAVVFLFEQPEKPRVSDVQNAPFIANYDSADVARIEISQLIDGVELVREGDGWKVSYVVTPMRQTLLVQDKREAPEKEWFLADKARVTSALGTFGGLDSGIVVSDNKDKQKFYQVDLTGLHVKLIDAKGNAIADVIIGKNGPDFTSSYIRKEGEDKVYMVDRTLTGSFSARTDDWRDRNITSIDPATITDITVEGKDRKFSISKAKDGNAWQSNVPEGAALDEQKVLQLVGRLAKLQTSGFAASNDNTDKGFDAPYLTIVVADSNNSASKLIVGNANPAGQRFAKLSGKDDIYLLDKAFIDSIPMSLVK